jgi:predicted dinucleotide-binding enzyme
MNIGILGSGDVGKALARGFIKRGDQVMIGSRSPEKLADFARESGAKSGTFEDTARFGQMLALATLGTAAEEALRMAGVGNFGGKVLIDATNPLNFAPGGPPTLAISGNDSLGERVQKWVPSARVVKAFNTVGNLLFVNPQLPGGPPDMFICGSDAEAKKTVADLCKQWGWGVIDIGGIEGSRYLEAMCMTWVLHGILSGSWTHAFKMLHQ